MSTAEVANQADSNAESAQDVKDMLAELKGSNQSEIAIDTAAVENGDVSKGSNGVESRKESESNEPGEKNGVRSSESKNEEEGKEEKKEKKEEVAEGERGERSQGLRPHHGGATGPGGGRGRGDYKNYKENIKSDVTAQEETDDPVQIRKQVEFYFSDSNLPMDKFLLSQVGGSKNLPVDLKIIHSFKRMRHFQPFSAIPAALKESTFLELTDDDTKVKRKEPLSEKVDPEDMDPNSIKVFEDRAMPRSVYVKGFGEEDSKTQLDIEAFFASYGSYNAIRLRRAHDKVFKGSVFVEFDSEETQQKFLDLEPKPQYKGKDLQIMSKKGYCEKKVEDIRSGKVKPNKREPHRGRGGYQNKRKRDDEDDRDWRERREDDRNNGHRGSRRDGRRGGGGGGGRGRDRDRDRDSKRGEPATEIRRDSRGVPIVESTEPPRDDDSNNSRAKREAATASALAKAKAMVEAENAKKTTTTTKPEDAAEGKKEPGTESGIKFEVDGGAEKSAAVASSAAATSKKRGRDDAEGEGKGVDVDAGLPGAKRVDAKTGKQDGDVDRKESMES